MEHDVPSKPPVALIGAGALGTALGLALHAMDYPIATVLSRTHASATNLAGQLHPSVTATQRFTDVDPIVRLFSLCVPDDALADIALELARVRHPWEDCVVFHTSGARTDAVLAPLAMLGATTLSYHPIQTFVPPVDAKLWHGIYVGVQSQTRKGIDFGVRLAAGLGAKSVVLEADDKARYHLAAALASNAFVALMGMVGEVLASIGVDRPTGAAMMQPLIANTWANLQKSLPEDALTGPVARGDVATIRQHAAALQRHLPQLLPAWAALVNEQTRVAVRGSKLSPVEAEAVLDVLSQALAKPDW